MKKKSRTQSITHSLTQLTDAPGTKAFASEQNAKEYKNSNVLMTITIKMQSNMTKTGLWLQSHSCQISTKINTENLSIF